MTRLRLEDVEALDAVRWIHTVDDVRRGSPAHQAWRRDRVRGLLGAAGALIRLALADDVPVEEAVEGAERFLRLARDEARRGPLP